VKAPDAEKRPSGGTTPLIVWAATAVAGEVAAGWREGPSATQVACLVVIVAATAMWTVLGRKGNLSTA
jgi:hypothetical protein